MTVKKNVFPLIGDITLKLESREDRAACVVSLDMGVDEVQADTASFEVSFNRAVLKVVCNGYDIIKSSRFGIPKQIQNLKVKKTTKINTMRDASASAETKANVATSLIPSFAANIEATAKGSAGVQRSQSTHEEFEAEILFPLVKARGGDTWEIGDKTNTSVLNGNYLDDDVLFEFAPSKDSVSNRRSIEMYLIVQQSDMNLERTPSDAKRLCANPFSSVNKKKISTIFAAKCLAKTYSLEGPYNGKFAISYIEEEVTNEYFSQ